MPRCITMPRDPSPIRSISCNVYNRLTWRVLTSALRMQWRGFLRHFAHPTTLPAFTPQPKWRLPTPQRAFHTVRCTVAVPSQEATVQSITSDEVEEVDEMAQQELTHLQKLLGLVESKHPVKDVFFVCVDCEAFEHDQTKITEIGMLSPLRNSPDRG
jgi:hypothetical protein